MAHMVMGRRQKSNLLCGEGVGVALGNVAKLEAKPPSAASHFMGTTPSPMRKLRRKFTHLFCCAGFYYFLLGFFSLLPQ